MLDPMEKPPPIEEEDILLVAKSLPADERAAYLEAACGKDPSVHARIERLLRAPHAGEFLNSPATVVSPEANAIMARLKPEESGDRVGPYRLRQQIGEGGFGTVWMAEQELPVRRRVALKIVKIGLDTREFVARFEQERQALALMDHPNIAKVLDGGATENGRPFFVMEHIPGIKITDYCDQASLGMRERLGLFVTVCRAVQHAHQKGIIHRDLKPSNILVAVNDGEPVPKVIDFGVAKAIQGRLTDKTLYTELDQMVGTLMYMSPEQAEMTSLDIDTRSDIYSLGVLLYELLTGRTPIASTTIEQEGRETIRRIIREVEPPCPSARIKTLINDELTATAKCRRADAARLSGLLRGDLDWIVMKCLEKDRSRRYETARGLALDIQRHLANKAVTARPPTTTYVLSRFVRRNKLLVGASIIVTVALLIGTGFSLWQASLAVTARDAKEQALQEARAAEAETQAFSDFLVNRVLAAARPKEVEGGLGVDVTVVDALKQAGARLEQDFAGRPRAEAVTREAIGITWQTLGLHEEAASQLEKAITIRERDSRPNERAVLKLLNDLAVIHQKAGAPERALPLYEKVLQKRMETLPAEHADVVLSMNNLAGAFYDVGRIEEAVTMGGKALDTAGATLGVDDPNTLKIMSNLARIWRNGGITDRELTVRALSLYKNAFSANLIKLGREHPDTLSSMNNLAVCYEQSGDIRAALPLFEQALELSRKALGTSHPDTLTSLNNLAGAQRAIGQRSKAMALYQEALEASRSKQGVAHPDTLNTMFNLAVAYEEAADIVKALPLYREVAEARRLLHGDDHRLTLKATSYLAVAYSQAGEMQRALTLFEQVFERRTATLGPDNPDTLKSMSNLARAFQATGDFPKAQELFSELLLRLNRKSPLGEGYPQIQDTERHLEEVARHAQTIKSAPQPAAVNAQPEP